MNETRRTLAFAGAAVVLAALALIFAPQRITPGAFLDQGEPFFPDFTDPNEAVTLEVIDFDEATGAARPFKVTFKDGRWTIPSHHDYPADGKDRLARTAAGVIDICKDDFRTDNISDHEMCGVIDPIDETAALSGRGQRVTIKGTNDAVLADLIIGHQVPERAGFRFVRVPEQNRVYVARMDVDISTEFSDWIEADLLQVDKNRIDRVNLQDYSINERTHSVDQRDNLMLTRQGETWSADRMKSTQQIDSTKLQALLMALDELNIVGVRPKPTGLSAGLKENAGEQKVSQAEVRSLQSKGFYFSRDGRLLSNEGETQAHTTDGVNYTLRFGEVVYGSGLAVTAGGNADTDQQESSAAQNRYLFITTDFDAATFPEPKKPTDTEYLKKADSLWTDEDRNNKSLQNAHERWQRDVEKGRRLSSELNARFADWYYVISAESFEKLRLTRQDLVVKKDAEGDD